MEYDFLEAQIEETHDNQYKDIFYGSCFGPDAIYVKLYSSDGHEFIIKRDYANIAATLKAMLEAPGELDKDEPNEVCLHEIPSHILQKVCKYLIYKVRYTDSSTEIPEFRIEPEISIELLMAANFLDC